MRLAAGAKQKMRSRNIQIQLYRVFDNITDKNVERCGDCVRRKILRAAEKATKNLPANASFR